jgi:hypothetical protein
MASVPFLTHWSSGLAGRVKVMVSLVPDVSDNDEIQSDSDGDGLCLNAGILIG